MTTNTKNINWDRIAPGYYTAKVGAVKMEIDHIVEGGSRWNLVVNGCCDDTYNTLRDAKVAATFHSSIN